MKGKGKLEEDPEKFYIPVYEVSEDDSEDHEAEFEMAAEGNVNRGRNEQGNGNRATKRGQEEAEGRQEPGDKAERGRRGRGRVRRGRGSQSRRGIADGRSRRGRRCRKGIVEDGETSTRAEGRQGRRTIETRVRTAERAYNERTNPKIRRIIENWEEEAIQAQSEEEMEDWMHPMPDPGHTRGRMTMYKQSLHLY